MTQNNQTNGSSETVPSADSRNRRHPPHLLTPQQVSNKFAKEVGKRVSGDILIALSWILFFGTLLLFHTFADRVELLTIGEEIITESEQATISFEEIGGTLFVNVQNLQSTPLRATLVVFCNGEFEGEAALRSDLSVRARGQTAVPLETPNAVIPCSAVLETDNRIIAEASIE